MRRLAVIAGIAAALAACGGSPKSPSTTLSATTTITKTALPIGTRSCGILGVGIGWHVSASATISCLSGMTLMRAYFHRRAADRTVLGYACASHRLGGRISCVRGETTVTAIANN
jgi:hypothetical protein